MYVTGPPPDAQPAGEPAGRLRLHRAGRRVFPETSDLAWDPQLRIFLGDMVRPYGLPLRDDLLTAGAGHSYAQMGEELVRATVPADEPVDVLVFAHGIHDIRLGQPVALYLSEVCPGTPLAFAVCDQGTAAAFTALRLAGEYGRAGCPRALLVVAEQTTLHYQPAGPAPIPDRHAAVALLFAPAGPAPLAAVRVLPAVPPADLLARLAAEVAVLAGGRADTTVLLGTELSDVVGPAVLAGAAERAELADRLAVRRLRRAPAGQPYTGVWWELAGQLPDRAADGGLVLLADYDRTLGYLSLAALDAGPAAGAAVAPTGQSAVAEPAVVAPAVVAPAAVAPAAAAGAGRSGRTAG